MTATTPVTCSACGSAASGRFCSNCGASLLPRQCESCRADLSAQARFCHRCGRPAGGAAPAAAASSDRTAWIFAGALCLVLVSFIIYKVSADAPAPQVPEMANAGSAGAAGAAGAPAGPAPDISQMTPRERFDRLFNRIMAAAEQRDSAQVQRFTPMALGAYAQLDTVDADARYHAAVIHLQAGDAPGALALADTILADSPGHLFGYVIRGTAAELTRDQAALARARRDFVTHFAAESASGRAEYLDHAPVLREFRQEAR